VTIYQIKSEEDLKEASKKMYDYVRGRIRLYLRILWPIEQNYKRVHIYFNMHFKADASTSTYSSLYPVNTIHDVAKVFFNMVSQ